MVRGNAYRRHQRRRMIRKRLKIILDVWRYRIDWDNAPWDWNWLNKPGCLSKHNLVCSCWMCSSEEYDRATFKRNTVRLLDETW